MEISRTSVKKGDQRADQTFSYISENKFKKNEIAFTDREGLSQSKKWADIVNSMNGKEQVFSFFFLFSRYDYIDTYKKKMVIVSGYLLCINSINSFQRLQ